MVQPKSPPHRTNPRTKQTTNASIIPTQVLTPHNSHPKTVSRGPQTNALLQYTSPLLVESEQPVDEVHLIDEEEFHRWFDDRPESPLKWGELIGSYNDDSDSGSLYEPEDSDSEENVVNGEIETHFLEEFDIESDLNLGLH